MRLRTLGIVTSILFGVAACEEAEEPAAEEKPAEAAAAAPAPAPAPEPAKPEVTAVTVCGALVEAAKAKDDAKFAANATEATAKALADAKVKESVMTMLSGATCAAEAKPVEGKADAATVAVQVGKDTRDVTFVKAGDAWKFDAAAYMEKYPPVQEKAKKGKKAKAGKKKKG